MSCLKETISETEFYGRDRGEDDVEAAYHATLEDVAKTGRSRGTEYVYLYENHIWHVKNGTKCGFRLSGTKLSTRMPLPVKNVVWTWTKGNTGTNHPASYHHYAG